MSVKIMFVDVETTGVDCKRNSIWSLAGEVWEQGGKQLLEIEYKVRPFLNDPIDPNAIKTSDISMEELAHLPISQKQFVYNLKKDFESVVSPFTPEDKMFLCAYSAVFDYDFLRATFSRTGDRFFGSYFWYPPICAMQIAGVMLRDIRATLPNFKLPTVFAAITGDEVVEAQLHTAKYDLKLLLGLYREMDEEFFKDGD